MKKFKLTDLNVQSFVTINESEVMKTAKGGNSIETRPANICNGGDTVPLFACQQSIPDCTTPPRCRPNTEPPACYTTC